MRDIRGTSISSSIFDELVPEDEPGTLGELIRRQMEESARGIGRKYVTRPAEEMASYNALLEKCEEQRLQIVDLKRQLQELTELDKSTQALYS